MTARVPPENIRPRDERRSLLVEVPKRIVPANAAAENAIFFCISIPGFLVSRFLCKTARAFPSKFRVIPVFRGLKSSFQSLKNGCVVLRATQLVRSYARFLISCSFSISPRIRRGAARISREFAEYDTAAAFSHHQRPANRLLLRRRTLHRS
jgi:hypothetical protein